MKLHKLHSATLPFVLQGVEFLQECTTSMPVFPRYYDQSLRLNVIAWRGEVGPAASLALDGGVVPDLWLEATSLIKMEKGGSDVPD
jgi:hypothetical protein